MKKTMIHRTKREMVLEFDGTYRSLFLLDPDVVFLNHGSFGACPVKVFEAYQYWQLALERQPVAFITSELSQHLNRSRASLAGLIGASQEDVLFVPNATHGVNQVVRSLDFSFGDEILTTDQEYGACENVLRYVCNQKGAVLRRQGVPLPSVDSTEWIEAFWSGVTERTKLIFLSHLTSSTAQRFPIKEVCRRARAAGILTLIDGAHAPGQIDLDLEELGSDFYAGNCHKWLMAPKGSGFLHVRREHQMRIEPLIVGWGLSGIPEFETGSPFIDHNQWLGTDDFSSYVAVADAIDFQREYGWNSVRIACSHLLNETLDVILQLTGREDMISVQDRGQLQMGVAELPLLKDIKNFKRQLLADYQIEVPLVEWNGRHLLRVSVQGYNTRNDMVRLVRALEELLPGSASEGS